MRIERKRVRLLTIRAHRAGNARRPNKGSAAAGCGIDGKTLDGRLAPGGSLFSEDETQGEARGHDAERG